MTLTDKLLLCLIILELGFILYNIYSNVECFKQNEKRLKLDARMLQLREESEARDRDRYEEHKTRMEEMKQLKTNT